MLSPYTSAHAPQDHSAATHPAPALSTLWWTPLAFVGLALLLLLVTPIVVDRRVAKLRNELTFGSEHARVLSNDIEADFASQLFVGDHGTAGGDSVVRAVRAHLDSDEVELHTTVRQISPEAVARMNELSAVLSKWRASPHDGASDPATTRQAREIFATAEQLDGYLATVSDSVREAARRLSSFDVISAVVLAPIAFFAMIVVAWMGQRVLTFARVAEHERIEVIRAADSRAALLRGVTHDVKNPLGAAAGYAQLLEEGVVGPLSESQIEMIRRIHRLVRVSAQTVTDLLELARSDGEGLQLDYTQTDLATLAREIVDDHRGLAQEHRLAIDVAAAPAPLVTDPIRVRQILSNLVSNAIKYTPPGGNVTVSVVREATATRTPRVGVEVKDTGPGIPPDLRSHVFEEFFRVHSAESGTNGNGLGLAISRRLARMLGGDVAFRDAEPHGAVFTLWLDGDGAAPPRAPA